MPVTYDTIAPFMYVIRIKNEKRDKLKAFLMEHEIETGISYIPCHHFSIFKGYAALPITDEIFNEILCLPMHFELTDADVATVTNTIKLFFSV